MRKCKYCNSVLHRRETGARGNIKMHCTYCNVSFDDEFPSIQVDDDENEFPSIEVGDNEFSLEMQSDGNLADD